MSKDPESFVKSLHKDGGAILPDGSVAVGPDWAMKLVEYPTKRPKFAPHKDDDMAEEEEVSEIKKGKALLDKPVENSGPVPLMPNLDANARHVITTIRVNKRTPPGDGIKGDVPDSTTVDFIARRWGDGIYDFEAMNESGQVLRRNTNVKIAMGYSPTSEQPQASMLGKMMMGTVPDNNMSDKLFERLESESKRAHLASESAVESARKLSQDYASMMREDAKERSEKDRAYHQAQTAQQGNFFQTMLVSMQTMHEQAMERSREQFQQTMQMMQMSHQQTLSNNNPALMFQLFERGLRFGADASSEAEESPLTSILGAATEGLSTVKDMMMLQQQKPPAMLPVGAKSQPAKKKENPAKKPPISREDMMEIIRLKRLSEQKGLDFSGLVKQAQTMVSNMPTSDIEAEQEEDTDAEIDDEESGESDVD